MANRVVFWNNWHNGDVHLSRGFVKQIMRKVHSIEPSISFCYAHPNDPMLLSDIPNLSYDREPLTFLDPHQSLMMKDETVFVNTWYDQQHQRFSREFGILTFDALYVIFNEACRQLFGFMLPECSDQLSDFFPSIDYRAFDIHHAKEWLSSHPEKKVLIENGDALSGQAHNFQMLPIIEQLAKERPNVSFVLSKKEKSILSNVFWTDDIIQKEGKTDLNEISFLSTHCDVIVGKASGVFSFSLVQENFFERQTSFLCFSHLLAHQSKYWLGRLFSDKVNYTSRVQISNETNADAISTIIKEHL